MMTFADELRNAVETDPLLDSDTEGHRPRRARQPKDAAGEDVRVFERDDPEALAIVLRLNSEKDVWAGEVWQDIVAMRHFHPGQEELRAAWLAMDDATKFAYHVRQKAPEHGAWWIVFRNGQPAHARLIDRHRPDEVWVQWVVGTRAVGRPSLTVAQALWDIGIRRICWKALAGHGLKLHWSKFPRFRQAPADEVNPQWSHHPGHYTAVVFEMPDRPVRFEDFLRADVTE